MYNLKHTMAKLYSKQELASTKMLPKSETIRFLLNYSKALTIVQIRNMKCEIIAN